MTTTVAQIVTDSTTTVTTTVLSAVATMITTTAKPSMVKKVMAYRLDVDEEFQGWILVFSTMTCFWLMLLPCYCAGLKSTCARRCAQKIALRPKMFYIFMFVVCNVLMYLIVTWLPDWEYADYLKAVSSTLKAVLGTMLHSIESIAIILVAVFCIAFKDRIAMMLGVDHKQIFRVKTRDVMSCFQGSRFQMLELAFLRVEDLSAGDMFQANNVFIEVWMGYNEGLKTRVHNNAGSACVLRQTLQLNYDEADEDEQLLILVKNQKMIGAGELGRLTLPAEKIRTVVEGCAGKPGGNSNWGDDKSFHVEDLLPRGRIYFTLKPCDEESHASESMLHC